MHRESSFGPGVADMAQCLSQEVTAAQSSVGLAVLHPGHQHFANIAGYGR